MSSFQRALSGVKSGSEAAAMAWGEKSGAQETLTRSQGRAHHLWPATSVIMLAFTKFTDNNGT